MESQRMIYNDLYLMLGPTFDSLHIRRSNEGVKGFEHFAWGNIHRLKNADLTPDNWMFHYRFTPEQLERLPALDGLRSRDYFRNLLTGLRHEGITPRQILPLDSAMQLELRDVFILEPLLNRPEMPLGHLLPLENNYIYELSMARPLFRAYMAVKSCQGVLLFSPTKHGAGLLQGYLQQTADHFFAPQMPQTELAIYRVPAFDPTLKDFVDRVPRIRHNPMKAPEPTSLPPELFASEKSLNNGLEILRYDMTPTWQNFNRLVFPQENTGLICSQRNYEIMHLLCIAQTGMAIPKLLGADDYHSRYASIFSNMMDDNAAPAELQRRAQELLDSEFAPIRGREPGHTLAQTQLLPEPDNITVHRMKL